LDLLLKLSRVNKKSEIFISGSKSETNRLLLLQALYPNIKLENSSNSDDSEVMTKALLSDGEIIDIHHAGTAMRFLTAYFAIQENREVVLTGSSRMKERPIRILVDALRQLGADISYVENEGFPPLRIIGKKLSLKNISIPANVSSQYISALLLIAPRLENGLELTLVGDITSVPYINMTLSLLKEIGVDASYENNCIKVNPINKTKDNIITIESDWSSASYYYSIIALSEIGTQITLSSFKESSLQGDFSLVNIYKNFGVETTFNEHSITISKSSNEKSEQLNLDLNNCPDIAQTIAVTSFALGIPCHLIGLHTLKIKETDRLEALKTELIKLGANVSVTNNSLTLEKAFSIDGDIKIATYQDHRMAMAFAPLAIKTNLIIEDAEVVSKSYPSFWKDLKHMGFDLQEIK
jgi:3-phosphoshikimate 1-carboxyvinyltransferase